MLKEHKSTGYQTERRGRRQGELSNNVVASSFVDPLLLEKTCLVAVPTAIELFGSCKLRKAGRPCAAAAAASNPAQSAPRQCRRHCRRPCYCLTTLCCSAVKQYTEALLYVVASKQPTNGLQDSRTAAVAAMRRQYCGA